MVNVEVSGTCSTMRHRVRVFRYLRSGNATLAEENRTTMHPMMVFLPNSNSFWCGVIHHENYKEKECFYIVFSPESANTSVYWYDLAKASQLMKAIYNYDVDDIQERDVARELAEILRNYNHGCN